MMAIYDKVKKIEIISFKSVHDNMNNNNNVKETDRKHKTGIKT